VGTARWARRVSDTGTAATRERDDSGIGPAVSVLQRTGVLLGHAQGIRPTRHSLFFPFLFLISFPSLFLLNSNYVAICLQIKCPLKHSVILFIFKILFFSFLCIFKYRI
jgi:hypothetical protein